ncbi:unnamed protein product [Soboliphyme baturini]|uniref:Poly(U)-binding-splicing factor PUF60 n=1 Tax=Soboliphyme baturini TaxID=241478 RepID=A0A183ISY0_9BILA|nr:unnamed protein product [Soboliphyme baturini]
MASCETRVLFFRVYIGSISFELREDTIKNAFAPFGPIKSINMSWDPVTGHHKGFAFLEYEVPEAATLAQEQMNGVLIGGRNIKVFWGNNTLKLVNKMRFQVGRPSNMPQAQPIIEMIMEEAKQYNRIYVSSIHPDLVEQDIKSVFEAFGRIINVDLPKGPLQGKHKGYAYIDYDTPQAAVDAVASMNLFDLGGQYLRVGRAITPPQAQQYIVPSSNSTLPTAAAVAAAAVTAKIQAMEVSSPVGVFTVFGQAAGTSGPVFVVPPPGVAIPQIASPRLFPTAESSSASEGRGLCRFDVTQYFSAQRLLQNASNERQQRLIDLETGQTLASQEDFKIKGNEARNILMHKLMRRQESSVVVLLNMVGVEDVDEYLQEEVTEECSKYGHVQQVVIYQEKQGEDEDAPVIVKIFVKYSNSQEAEKAKETFNGRYFSGRQIKAELYDQMLFEHNDLSG